jgi:thioredoxin reductase
LPNEDLAKVTYNLLDPEQYSGCDVAVVGGGNAGVEAAQMLGKSGLGCKVTLLVHGASMDRANDENRKKIEAMQKQGLVDIWYNSKVTEIQKEFIIVDKAGKPVQLANQYLFVFIGADVPHAFLMGLGIQIDKKFGERLQSAE